MDEAAESIEGLRGGGAGRFARAAGVMMVLGDAGGEVPAEDSTGADTLRSWAYADGREGWVPPLGGLAGAVVGVGVCM